jgi:hypothetical protein
VSYYDREDVGEDIGEDIGEATPWKRPQYQFNRPRPYVPPRPAPNTVSGPQVTSAFDKVGTDVRALAAQVKEIEARVDTNQGRGSKTLTALRNDLNQTKTISALLPLLSRPGTKEITEDVAGEDGGTVLTKGDKLAKASDDTISLLLPLLLLTGGFGGGSDSSSQQQGGMDSSMMMMLVLVLALRDKK